MTRLFALCLLAAVAGHAAADIPPPPLAKDETEVSVTSKVVLGKEVKGYVFVEMVGKGPGAPRWTYKKVELDTKTATTMPNNARYTYVSLVAVPEEAAKGYKTDKELFEALEGKKVKGVHEVSVGGGVRRMKKAEVKGDSLTKTHTITAIDPKDGIKTTVETEGLAEKKGDKPGEKKPVSLEPGSVVGGAAAALAVCLGGLWLVRRRK